MSSKDIKCQHSLAITAHWIGGDKDGNRERMVCGCVKCGLTFDCTQIRVDNDKIGDINAQV